MPAALILDFRAHDLQTKDLRLIERLIRESRTWALVDILSGDVVGEMAIRLRIRGTLDRWSRDEDFWVRRSSLLAEIKPLKNRAPFEPFARRANAMLEETEFFIRKAIGWGPARDFEEAPGRGLSLDRAAHSSGLRGDRARNHQIP